MAQLNFGGTTETVVVPPKFNCAIFFWRYY